VPHFPLQTRLIAVVRPLNGIVNHQFSSPKPHGCEGRAGSPPRKARLQKGYAEADELPAPVCIGGNGDCSR
jgi:hypothetical protein